MHATEDYERLISKHGNLTGVDNDQYIKKEGVEGFFRLMDNSELTYLVSPKPNREYTIIKLETSKFEVFKEAEGQTFTSFKAMTSTIGRHFSLNNCICNQNNPGQHSAELSGDTFL